jgi:hypothetical protein
MSRLGGSKGVTFVRLLLAIISFVVAATLIGLGIAQKTIWALPDRIDSSISISTSAPVTVIDGTALNANRRSQTPMAARVMFWLGLTTRVTT